MFEMNDFIKITDHFSLLLLDHNKDYFSFKIYEPNGKLVEFYVIELGEAKRLRLPVFSTDLIEWDIILHDSAKLESYQQALDLFIQLTSKLNKSIKILDYRINYHYTLDPKTNQIITTSLSMDSLGMKAYIESQAAILGNKS